MKRIISLILAISMIITLIPFYTFSKEYVVYETFDKYSFGNIPTLSDGITVSGQSGTVFEVKEDPSDETDKSLYLKNDATSVTTSGSHYSNIYLAINKKGKLTIEFKIYPVDTTAWVHIGLTSSQLTFRGGNLQVWKKGTTSSVATGFKYNVGAWNTLKLVIDTDSEVYDCYLNGQTVFTNTALRGDDGYYKENGIVRCLFQSQVTNGNSGETYFDDIKVISGAESEAFTPSVILKEGEEGLNLRWRPVDKFVTYENPPLFTWPPISKAYSYTIQMSKNEDMSDCVSYTTYENYFSPSQTMDIGVWYWRIKGINKNGETEWSDIKRFRIAENARANIIPDASQMASRIVTTHPRLWFNNDTLTEYRNAVKVGDAYDAYQKIKSSVDSITDTTAVEPQKKYPNGTKDQRADYAFSKLENMYHLAFVFMIEGELTYMTKAKELLLAVTAWDPMGFTGYTTHDQVHRDVTLKCAIVYDWLHSFLSESERQTVLKMIESRMNTMYSRIVLNNPLDEKPYDSHGRTALNMMFTVCFATMYDIPEAEEWFENIQPIFYKINSWGGEDGGYANGTGYSNSTTVPAGIASHDMVYTATGYKSWEGGANAGETPNKYYMFFFSNGAPVGSFGDDETIASINERVSLTRYLADAVRYNDSTNKWASETRGRIPYKDEPMLLKYFESDVESIPPFDMINSYYDRDIGWIAMKSDIIDPWHTAVHFKSSFWGTYNHSHAENNGFMIYAYGEPLAVSTGYYDSYYSDHDKYYSHQTLAHNAITINGGQGQTVSNTDTEASINAKGKITGYLHGDKFNLASGNAEKAYPDLDKADRYLIYLKPDYVIVIDELSANDDTPTQYEFNLKGFSKYEVDKEEQTAILTQGRAKLFATFQYPKVTDIEEFDSFIGIDGKEHRPATVRDQHRKDHYGVRFDTEKTADTVMVTTLDVLKAEDENKNVTVNKNSECMEIVVDGNKKVYVRLDYNKEEVSFKNVSFKGTAAVFEDDSFMIVNGTELVKDGVTLISCDKPTDVSYETGEIHIFGNDDGKVNVKLPFEILEIKNENGFEIADYNSANYDYSTMPYKWTQGVDNIISIDYEAGIHNMYLNGTPVMKYDGLTVRINGRVAEYENKAFKETDGTIYVPLDETVSMYGATVEQSDNSYVITKAKESYGDFGEKREESQRQDRTMTVYANSANASYNGNFVTLEKPTKLIDDVLYIPLKEYYEVFTERIGWSDDAETAWVYTEPVYRDDLSSTVFPSNLYMDDVEYGEYIKEKSVTVTNEDSGKVDVSFNSSDSIVNYTITPNQRCYIENITYNGIPYKAFDSRKVTIQTDETSDKFNIVFNKFNSLDPVLLVSPFKYKDGDNIYLFLKLIAYGIEISEYGMVMSIKESNPDVTNAIKVPFDKNMNSNGYYGYEVENKTGIENQPFYIRPYAKVGEDYIYGDVSYVEPSKI